MASFNTKVTQKPDVVKPSKSQLNVDTDTETPAGTETRRTQEQGRTSQEPLQDTDNPIYRSSVEEAAYGEADTDPIDESVSINRMPKAEAQTVAEEQNYPVLMREDGTTERAIPGRAVEKRTEASAAKCRRQKI